jgi:hypothetical protein
LSSSGLKVFEVVSDLFWESGEGVGVEWVCHGGNSVRGRSRD